MAVRSIPAIRTAFRPALPGIGEVVAMVRTWARVRATRRMLAEMDARMLADIGASRGDAIIESQRPFWDCDAHR